MNLRDPQVNGDDKEVVLLTPVTHGFAACSGRKLFSKYRQPLPLIVVFAVVSSCRMRLKRVIGRGRRGRKLFQNTAISCHIFAVLPC
jgi:hypothetical protein